MKKNDIIKIKQKLETRLKQMKMIEETDETRGYILGLQFSLDIIYEIGEF